MDLLSNKIKNSRFTGDAELLEKINSDERLTRRLRQAKELVRHNTLRARLLSNAVRVDLRSVPNVAESLHRLKTRAGIDVEVEPYIYDEAGVNAFVGRGQSHTLVGLSSGAVNNLNEAELEFVIGHEFGHAIFGHVDVVASQLLNSGGLEPRECMQLLAWQRSAEISADRAGLICCDSLEVAATALFKTLSGLKNDTLKIDPIEFAEQWSHLEEEVIAGGERDHWELSHPFPPLRMKAMVIFWNSGFFQQPGDAAAANDAWAREACDNDVNRLLALMDPLAHDSKDAADPILADYLLWGGMYVAMANGELHPKELEYITHITSKAKVDEIMRDGIPVGDMCLASFCECIDRRRRRLKALEIHSIFQALLEVAIADGEIDQQETAALEKLAEKLGINASACNLLISKFLDER